MYVLKNRTKAIAFMMFLVFQTVAKENTGLQRPENIDDKKWASLKTAVQEVKLLPSSGGGDDHNFGNSVSVDGNRMVVGALNYSFNTIVHGAVYVFDFDGTKWNESEILTPFDGNNGDNFGVSVSLSGTRLLIGAIGDDDSGNGAGVVFAYNFDGVSWQFTQKLIADDAAAAFGFGVSLSLSQNRVLIGSDKAHDDLNNTTGAAYVFELNGNSWNQTNKIIADDADSGDSFGASVSLSGNRALIGATLDDDNVANSGSAYVFDFDGNDWNQTQKLTAPNGNSFDLFGLSVSLSGNRALISAEGDDDSVSDSGAAYVFDLDGNNWNLTQKIKVFDGGVGDSFGASVSLLGNRALIGASRDDDNGTNAGAAYIFDFNGNSWSQTQKLTASDTGTRDSFGNSVSLSGNRVLIGASKDDSNGENSGSAYMFDKNSINWNQSQKVLAVAGSTAAEDRFGVSVSLSGNKALIGAFEDDDNGIKSGSAYIFDFDGDSWNQTQKLTALDADDNDLFGLSVSLSNNRALIGALGDDDNGNLSGAVYIFDFDGISWAQTIKITSSDNTANDRFGASVSLSGNRALIGAIVDNVNGISSGSAYIFDFDGNNWNQTQRITSSDGEDLDNFGSSVSLSGNRALIGAKFDDSDDSRVDVGSAYIFDFDGNSWSETEKIISADGAIDDNFGNSVSLSGNRALIGAVNSNGFDSGSAYVFDFDGNGWVQTQKLTGDGGGVLDGFGISVSLSGNKVVIGAFQDNSEDNILSGSAYIFDFNGNSWNKTQKLFVANRENFDKFGGSVSLSGNQILIGVNKDDDRGTDSGSAYLFNIINDLIYNNGFEN